MKSELKYGILLTFVSVLFMPSCSDDTNTVSETKRVEKLLLSETWQVTTVTVDEASTNVYDGLSLNFSTSSLTSSNGEPLWPASDTWSFLDESAKAIKRGDGLVMDIRSITEAQLKLELTWSKTTMGGGRTSSIAGKHVFTFNH